MITPQTWIAVLRIVVGAWFVKAVWTKLVIEWLWDIVPYPAASPRFLAFHPKRVAEFAAGNPVAWYRDFLEGTVTPNSRVFATLQAYGEAAVGTFERGQAHWSRAWGLGMLGRFLADAP